MSENLQAQACTDEEADAARDAGLLILTTQDERDIHDFAERIRAPLVERIAELERELEACRELDVDMRVATTAPVERTEPTRYFWSRPDSEMWRLCTSIDEAHSEAMAYIDEEFESGSVIGYEVGEAVPALIADDRKNTRRDIADNILEQLDMWAGENSGAEDETFSVTDEERDALGDLVMYYVLSHAKHSWFTAKPKTVTQHTYAAVRRQEGGGENENHP